MCFNANRFDEGSIILTKSCDEEYLVNKQKIHHTFVNRALEKLTEINPFYKNVTVNEQENISEQSHAQTA